MDDDVEQDILWCARTDFAPTAPSTTMRCADCGTEVWLSQEMRPLVEVGELKPVCGPCAADHYHNADDAVVTIHPLQIDALVECGALGFAMGLVDKMNRRKGKKTR